MLGMIDTRGLLDGVNGKRELCNLQRRILVPVLCSQPGSHLAGDCVVLKEVVIARKLHSFALDEDEEDALSGGIEEFGPAGGLAAVRS